MTVFRLLALAHCVLFAMPALAYDDRDQAADEAKLLDLHRQVIRCHIDNDLDAWMADESEAYTVASRGEVLHPTIAERRARLQPYLASTIFSEYRDLIDPIVRVSSDGSLGWVICQIKIAGEQTNASGDKSKVEAVWAWIELYEKHDGKWKRTGNVSNMKPPETKPEHGE